MLLWMIARSISSATAPLSEDIVWKCLRALIWALHVAMRARVIRQIELDLCAVRRGQGSPLRTMCGALRPVCFCMHALQCRHTEYSPQRSHVLFYKVLHYIRYQPGFSLHGKIFTGKWGMRFSCLLVCICAEFHCKCRYWEWEYIHAVCYRVS